MITPLTKKISAAPGYPVGTVNLQMSEGALKGAAHALYDAAAKIRFASGEMDYHGKPHHTLDEIGARLNNMAFDLQRVQIDLAVVLQKELETP